MGASYDENEANAIYQAFSNCDVWSIGVVRVYKAVGGRWNSTGITGAAVMASEKGPNEEDLCYIRVFDLKTNSTVLEQELWYFFNYEEATPWFHTFESNDFTFGLSFADETEASDFFNKVIESVDIQKAQAPEEADPSFYDGSQQAAYTPSAPAPAARGPPPPGPSGPPPPGPSGPPPSAPSHPPIAHGTPSAGGGSGNLGQAQVIEGLPMKAIPIRNALIGKDSSPSKQAPQKKKSGFFGFGKKKEEPVHVPVVGAPTDFKHESHIGWDPERGFEIRNIPPEWKALFQAAGVKKSELTNATTAKMIMETVVEVVTGVAPPPPPPPPGPPPPPVPGGGGPRPPAAPGAPPPPGGGGGGGVGRVDLLSQIQAGKNLKKVDETAVAAGVPDLKNLDAGASSNLAQILSDRLKAMRPALEDVDSDEEQADEDWS